MIHVQFVTSDGCEHCEEVKEILGNLKKEYALEVKEIDMASERGMTLVLQYRIMLAPAIIVNNQLVATGKVSEKNVREKLDALKKSK